MGHARALLSSRGSDPLMIFQIVARVRYLLSSVLLLWLLLLYHLPIARDRGGLPPKKESCPAYSRKGGAVSERVMVMLDMLID